MPHNAQRRVIWLVALACLAVASGLPKRRAQRRAWLVAAALAVALVSLPLAARRSVSPPLAHKLARYAATRLEPGRAALVVTPDVSYLTVFLE